MSPLPAVPEPMIEVRRFRDRREAGRRLAKALEHYRGMADAIVLALPRGGVPVGYEVANALGLPLDVFVVRKLGVPGHEELALGAIASGGKRIVDESLAADLGIDSAALAAIADRETRILEERERRYRGSSPPAQLAGSTVLLVDDGLATGASMRVAAEAVRDQGPRKICVAVPIAPPDTCEEMRQVADEVVCAVTPARFHAVGHWFKDFRQTSDDEVVDLLQVARAQPE